MIKRGAPPKKRRGKPRRGPLRDAKYRSFLSVAGACAPCAIEGISALWEILDAAHTFNNGMSSKGPDSTCAPLCRIHHQEYDAGRLAFEHKYKLDMKAIAAAWWSRYLTEN